MTLSGRLALWDGPLNVDCYVLHGAFKEASMRSERNMGIFAQRPEKVKLQRVSSQLPLNAFSVHKLIHRYRRLTARVVLPRH